MRVIRGGVEYNFDLRDWIVNNRSMKDKPLSAYEGHVHSYQSVLSNIIINNDDDR